jgi:hypothetical protein
MIRDSATSLTTNTRRTLVVGGALIGALIGPLGFVLRTDLISEATPTAAGRFLRAFATTGGGLVFVAVAFVATLVLMPALIGWLARQAHRTAAPFYFRAALAGIVFGVAATVLTTAGLMVAALVAGALSPTAPPESRGASGVAALGIGALMFAPLMGMFAVPFFVTSIVAFGVPFGLLFGALVRHFSGISRSGAQR